jgi:uncharacterized protein YoaH (UPF0181 family)
MPTSERQSEAQAKLQSLLEKGLSNGKRIQGTTKALSPFLFYLPGLPD